MIRHVGWAALWAVRADASACCLLANHTQPSCCTCFPGPTCPLLQAFRAPTSRDVGPQAGEEDAKGPGEQWIEEDIEEEDPAELAHHRMMKEDLNHVLLTLSEVRAGMLGACVSHVRVAQSSGGCGAPPLPHCRLPRLLLAGGLSTRAMLLQTAPGSHRPTAALLTLPCPAARVRHHQDALRSGRRRGEDAGGGRQGLQRERWALAGRIVLPCCCLSMLGGMGLASGPCSEPATCPAAERSAFCTRHAPAPPWCAPSLFPCLWRDKHRMLGLSLVSSLVGPRPQQTQAQFESRPTGCPPRRDMQIAHILPALACHLALCPRSCIPRSPLHSALLRRPLPCFTAHPTRPPQLSC